VQKADQTTLLRRNFRRIIAVAFLVFLLAEWGSHSLTFSHSSSNESSAVHAQHGPHEDLCKTLIRCPDGPRQELPPPNAGHVIAQQRSPFAGSYDTDRERRAKEYVRSHRAKINALFRTAPPPFHPPELS
jgi:hypothetical protein